jgi:hypothetical protein
MMRKPKPIKQYLIVERQDDQPYCYIEDEDHHVFAEEHRTSCGLVRTSHQNLDDECNIFSLLTDGSYMVVLLSAQPDGNKKKKV